MRNDRYMDSIAEIYDQHSHDTGESNGWVGAEAWLRVLEVQWIFHNQDFALLGWKETGTGWCCGGQALPRHHCRRINYSSSADASEARYPQHPSV